MAISINWLTKVILVPRADLTHLGGLFYELDVNDFRLALKDIEDSEDGICFPETHRHNTQVTLSGVIYARAVEIINGYTVEFEDVGSPYVVTCVGANHNLADVKVVNQVSLIIGNAAGLIVSETGVSGLTTEESDALLGLGVDVESMEKILRNKKITFKSGPNAGKIIIYDDDGVTPLYTADIFEDDAATQPYRGSGAERQERLE